MKYVEQHMENVSVTYPQLMSIVTNMESTMIAAGCTFKETSVQCGGSTAWLYGS